MGPPVKAHVCIGSEGVPHDPVRMDVDKNGVDIFRLPDGEIHLTEGRGWQALAMRFGVNDFDGLVKVLDQNGGDYFGAGDRIVCPTCATKIVWRV